MKKSTSIILGAVGASLFFYYFNSRNRKKRIESSVEPTIGKALADTNVKEESLNLYAYNQLSNTVMDSYHGSPVLEDISDSIACDSTEDLIYDMTEYDNELAPEENPEGKEQSLNKPSDRTSALSKEEILLNRLEEQIDFDWEQLL